jgi:hypothetical protein
MFKIRTIYYYNFLPLYQYYVSYLPACIIVLQKYPGKLYLYFKTGSKIPARSIERKLLYLFMTIDDLNELPEWDDGEFGDEDDDGEEWKPKSHQNLVQGNV